jgi:hypothetical protein
MKKLKIPLIKDLNSFKRINRNIYVYFSSKDQDKTDTQVGHHKLHKRHEHHHKDQAEWDIMDLPNINTTKSLNSKETHSEYGNHNHGLFSTRKIYGNMLGMDKVDEYITTEDLDKDFLKDGAKSSRRPEKGEYVFRGNLNIDPNSPPEKDVTDENKKIN